MPDRQYRYPIHLRFFRHLVFVCLFFCFIVFLIHVCNLFRVVFSSLPYNFLRIQLSLTHPLIFVKEYALYVNTHALSVSIDIKTGDLIGSWFSIFHFCFLIPICDRLLCALWVLDFFPNKLCAFDLNIMTGSDYRASGSDESNTDQPKKAETLALANQNTIFANIQE